MDWGQGAVVFSPWRGDCDRDERWKVSVVEPESTRIRGKSTGCVGRWEIIPLSGNMASTNRLQILNRVGSVFYHQIRPNCCIAIKP
jgi:hypothetical protein